MSIPISVIFYLSMQPNISSLTYNGVNEGFYDKEQSVKRGVFGLSNKFCFLVFILSDWVYNNIVE